MEWTPLELSLQVAAIATVVSAVLGVAIAAVLARPRFWGRELLDALATAPLVLPPTVLGYYCLTALGRRSAIGQAFEAVTGIPIVFSFIGCVVAAVLGGLPLVIKAARTALEGVDDDLVRAARTLGASPLRAFMTVRLPLAARGILAGIMLSFAKSLGEFGITLMIAGNIPGDTQTASLFIYSATQAGRDMEATGMVILLTAVAIGLLYGVNLLTTRRDHG